MHPLLFIILMASLSLSPTTPDSSLFTHLSPDYTSQLVSTLKESDDPIEDPIEDAIAPPIEPSIYYGALEVQGAIVPFGTYMGPYAFSDLFYTTQAYIDQGQAIVGAYDINPYDGLGSWVAGHNPGIMTPIVPYMTIGQIVNVWSYEGQCYPHQVTEYYQLYSYAENTSAEAVALIDSMGWREVVAVQYCVGDSIEVWIMSPL